jgi:WXG100 family type VII secretion target
MPAQRFHADYEELVQIAQRFGREAEAAQRMVESLRSAMNTLEGGDWQGQGARAFYAEMNSAVLPSLNRMAKALANAQRTTAQISREVKAGEDEAAAVLNGKGLAGAFGISASGSVGVEESYTPSSAGSSDWQAGGVARGSYARGQVETTLDGIGKITASGRVLGGEAGWGWNRDVQGAYAEGSVLQGSGTVQLGTSGDGWFRNTMQVDVLAGSAFAGHRGSNYGIGGEVNSYKLSETTVIGTKDLGITRSGEYSGPNAAAFAGVKDGMIGAEANASLASAKVETGLNVLGWNIGIVGEASAGVGAGFKAGRSRAVARFGPFALGLSFGSAK